MFYATLEKKVKNIIQWKRGSSLNNLDRISVMRNDLDELKENEEQLDNLIDKIKLNNNRQTESKMAYVTCQDIHNIDTYKEQMVMVVKAPSESQLILMDGDPPPVVLKSEKEEIDIFFCPDPSSGEMHQADKFNKIGSDTDDDEASTTTRPHRKAASSTASANKRKGVGSAQRNLSKAFEEMIPASSRNGKSKSNLFKAFNATVCRESSNDGTNEDTEDDDAVTSTKPFTSTTITTKDLLLLSDPSSEELDTSFGIKKDVKMSLFSPQKSFQVNWTDLPDMANLSPTSSFTNSYDPTGFFPLEPEAEYNFMLADSEGIMDLFDYKI